MLEDRWLWSSNFKFEVRVKYVVVVIDVVNDENVVIDGFITLVDYYIFFSIKLINMLFFF